MEGFEVWFRIDSTVIKCKSHNLLKIVPVRLLYLPIEIRRSPSVLVSIIKKKMDVSVKVIYKHIFYHTHAN